MAVILAQAYHLRGLCRRDLKCFNPGTKTEAGASSSSGAILISLRAIRATGRTKTEAGRI
jgi:hypothetical protein